MDVPLAIGKNGSFGQSRTKIFRQCFCNFGKRNEEKRENLTEEWLNSVNGKERQKVSNKNSGKGFAANVMQA